MPDQMSRLLAEILKSVLNVAKRQQVELKAHLVTLQAVKTAYPDLALQIDDYLKTARSHSVLEEEPGRARFEALLEKFLQSSAESLSASEEQELREVLKQELLN